MQKQLHHYSKIHNYQFVTFRTRASIDDFMLKLKDADLDESNKQLQVDKHLDNSNKGRLLNDEVIHIVLEYSKHLEPEFYKLICISVMPNHIHILFEQIQNLSKIMHKLKGGLAYKINKHLNLKGSFWERDYFDKVIRNEKHFQVTYKYIKNNAQKAKLEDADTRFYGIYG